MAESVKREPLAFRLGRSQKGTREGFVVRNYEAFEYKDFQKNVAKYVRASRPITPPNWDGREHNKLWKKNIDKS